MSDVYIYGLKDPRTGEIRYVGKTINPRARYQFHVTTKDVNRHKWNWLQDMKRAGAKPEIVILEVTDNDHWEQRERYWISTGHKSGWPLTNIAEGGKNNLYSTSRVDDALLPYLNEVGRLRLAELTDDEKLSIATEAAQAAVPFKISRHGYDVAYRIINERMGVNV